MGDRVWAGMVVALAVSAPAAGAPHTWHQVETAVALHPVGDSFVARWQAASRGAMAGPEASVWFRDLSNRLSTRWRLAELSGVQPEFSEELRDRTIDAVLAGSLLGWEVAVRDTVQRSPALNTAYEAGQALSTPSVKVRKGRRGARVSADDRVRRSQEAAFTDIDQGQVDGAPGGERSVPALRAGSAVTLVRIPTTTEGVVEEQRGPSVQPGVSSYIQVEDFGVDAVRLQTLARRGRIDPLEVADYGKRRPRVLWAGIVRQGLLPSVSLVAEVRGDGDALSPDLMRGSVDWRVPVEAPVVLRASVSRAELEGSDLVEDVAMLSLRLNRRWRLPNDPTRGILGAQPLAPGPQPVWTPPRGPNAVAPIQEPPVARHSG